MMNTRRAKCFFKFLDVRSARNWISSHQVPIRGSFWPWSKKQRNEKQTMKIVRPKQIDCISNDSKNQQILVPECKVAVIVGGASDMGFNAADCLLHHGARAVVLADGNPVIGERAAANLCDFYGKNRARYLRCDLGSLCQLEGVFEEAICRYARVDVLFSNLDRKNEGNKASAPNAFTYSDKHMDILEKKQLSNTGRAIEVGLKYMGLKNKNHSGGLIVNAASIIGFMGWPADPIPIYCHEKEPVAETTMDLAKLYPVEETGVRLVAILMSSRNSFDEIGLPDFPSETLKNNESDAAAAAAADNYFARQQQQQQQQQGQCEFSGESRIGKALLHVMLHARTGSTWLSEPIQSSTREIPWEIHFPTNLGETIDPNIYQKQILNYSRALEPVPRPILDCPENCKHQVKCKELWKAAGENAE